MKRLLLALMLGGCAGPALVPGQSTLNDVEAKMGKPAEVRSGVNGEQVYYYPQLPWGYATYAARIAPDGRLKGFEQRLTVENTGRVKPGVTRAAEVRDLLGPPFEPMKRPSDGNDIWTYPMRVPGDPTPRWFLVTLSPDGVVRDTHTITDPHWNQPDGGRLRR